MSRTLELTTDNPYRVFLEIAVAMIQAGEDQDRLVDALGSAAVAVAFPLVRNLPTAIQDEGLEALFGGMRQHFAQMQAKAAGATN